MELTWYPINPALDKDGGFAALSHLGEPIKYKPNDKPSDGKLYYGEAQEKEQSLAASLAGELSLVGSVSASVAANTRVIYRDVALWDESGYDGSSAWCKNTAWGVGFRLVLTMSKLSSEFDFDLNSVAVASELGLTNVSFQILVFGFAEPSLLSKFPIPGRFDTETWEEIQKAESDIRSYIGDKKNIPNLVYTAVPFRVYIDKFPGPPPNFLRAQSRLFAMEQIRINKYHSEAKEKAGERNLLKDVVRDVYVEHGLIDGNDNDVKFVGGEAENAKSWIEKTELEAKDSK